MKLPCCGMKSANTQCSRLKYNTPASYAPVPISDHIMNPILQSHHVKTVIGPLLWVSCAPSGHEAAPGVSRPVCRANGPSAVEAHLTGTSPGPEPRPPARGAPDRAADVAGCCRLPSRRDGHLRAGCRSSPAASIGSRRLTKL